MLTPRALAFLHGGRMLRSVRAAAQRHIQDEPALRLQPGLLDILVAPAPIPDPAAILAQRGGVALCGPPNSGRSLAMLQIQARWAASSAGGPVISLALAAADVANLSPRAVVAGAIHRGGLPAAYAEGGRPMLLLLDDWEDLPADRRALWRSYVIAAAGWAAARVVLSLPPGELWPGLKILSLTAPDDEALAGWIGQLLPGHEPGPILDALRREPLAAMRASVGELLLLTLIYPISGTPRSRSQLYEQAYALTRPVLDEVGRRLSVGRAALRHYRLARGLAGGADLAALAALPASEIVAVAPLAAGLLDDPRPVLRLLWADGSPGPSGLRGLAACLRERPVDAPDEHLRLVERLTTLGDLELLALVVPALPDVLAAASGGHERRAMGALRALAERWPGEETGRMLLALIDRQDVGAPLRWAAADLLAARPEAPAALAEPATGADGLALAARAYAVALAAPGLRRLLLGEALRAGTDALIAGAGGAERRAAAALALLADPECPSDLRALALAGAADNSEGAALIRQALSDRSPALRRFAVDALAGAPPAEAARLIGAAMADAGDNTAALRDLLTAAAQLPQREATGLIARYALGARGEIGLRIVALRLLSSRPGAAPLLQRFLAANEMPTAMRAAAARLIGAIGDAAGTSLLRHTLLGGGPPLLRWAAAEALSDLARTAAGRSAAISALLEALARPDPDAGLTTRIAAALGAAGATAAIPALSTLLYAGRPSALRAGWVAAVPELAHAPAAIWQSIPLSPSIRAVLLDSLATGGTAEDQPSSLQELSVRQAEQTAVAAAAALAAIADQRPDLAAGLCSRIRRAILGAPGLRPPAGLLVALARAAGDNVVGELEAILDSPAGTPALRWAALDQLGCAPTAAGWVLERLRSGGDDLFTRGKLATLLGDIGDPRAVPALGAIAAGQGSEPHLRMCAAVALGQIGRAEAHLALLAIIRSGDAPTPLRVAAVGALAHPLSGEIRLALRQVARGEGGEPQITGAIGKTLARAGEREILPLLLREAQSERPEEAIGAIGAIGDLGDPGAAPVLVRISQSAIASPGVRLAAVASLLRLDGPAHLPLLRVYLDSPIPPLRLRAHQILAQIDPASPQLIEPASDVGAPLALRLTAVESLLAQLPALSLAEAILKHADEPPQLRISIAGALGRSGSPGAAQTLREALGADGPPLLRRRCVEALGALADDTGDAGAAARAGLSALAQGADTPAELRHWADAIIVERALDRSTP